MAHRLGGGSVIDILKALWGPSACPWCNNEPPGWFERLYAYLAYRRPLRFVTRRLDYCIGTLGLAIHDRHR